MIIRLQGERVSRSSQGTPSFDDDFIDDANDELRDEFLELLDKMASNSHRSAHGDDAISASIAAAAAIAAPPSKAPELSSRIERENTDKVGEERSSEVGADSGVDTPLEASSEGVGSRRMERRESKASGAERDMTQDNSKKDPTSDESLSADPADKVATSDGSTTITSENPSSEVHTPASADGATLAILEGGVEDIALATIATSESDLEAESNPVSQEEVLASEALAAIEPPSSAEIAAVGTPSTEVSEVPPAEIASLAESVESTNSATEEVAADMSAGAASEVATQTKNLPSDIAEFLANARQIGAQNAAGAKDQLDAKGTAMTATFVPLQQRPDAVVTLALLKQGFEQVKGAISELKGLQGASGLSASATAQQNNNLVAPGAEAQNAAKTSHGVLKESTRALPKGLANRTLERVESALKEAARSRDGKTLSFRLDPPQLGQVKVDVTLKDGALHARMTPENQQVATLLRERAPELQSTLRRLGLNVETVTVSVGNESSSSVSTGGGEASADGKSFQQERKNMPGEGSQVVDNTFGNELANETLTQTHTTAAVVTDHWVA